MYKSLNDAKKYDGIFNPGTKFKIWYVRDELSRRFAMGLRWMIEVEGNPFDLNRIGESHVCIGPFAGSDDLTPYEVGSVMQGPYWAPNGEAREMLHALGIHHTSLEPSDIIQIDDKFYCFDQRAHDYIEFNNTTFKLNS